MNFETATKHTLARIKSVAFFVSSKPLRFALCVQVPLIVFAVIWFKFRPNWAIQRPGVAMAFLAVVAIIMAVRGERASTVERVVWVAASVALFVLEMVAIRDDHADLPRREEAARQEQARSFSNVIAQGQNLIQSLEEEKKLSVNNLKLTARNLEHITGGDEYCWVAPNFQIRGSNSWTLTVMNSGDIPLPTCDLQFMETPSEEQLKRGLLNRQDWLVMHFGPVAPRWQGHAETPYIVQGDRNYSGRIATPSRNLMEEITFETDPKNPNNVKPHCKVFIGPTVPQSECFPKVKLRH